MNLSDERAVGLKQEEKLEMQLVKPLTQFQLLKDMKMASNVTVAGNRGIYYMFIKEQAACSTHTHKGIKYTMKACRLFCIE